MRVMTLGSKYRDALCDVTKAKRKGEEIHRAAAVEEEEAPGLTVCFAAKHRTQWREQQAQGNATAALEKPPPDNQGYL
jgi:hypothetical protein